MTETIAAATRSAVEAAQAYLAAWNAHNGGGVLATFDAAGTYVDPTLPAPISGDSIAAYVTGLSPWARPGSGAHADGVEEPRGCRVGDRAERGAPRGGGTGAYR
jgi:hypothetical protein